jgi:hypothetical protein
LFSIGYAYFRNKGKSLAMMVWGRF